MTSQYKVGYILPGMTSSQALTANKRLGQSLIMAER